MYVPVAPNVAEPKTDVSLPIQLLLVRVLPLGFRIDMPTPQPLNVELDVCALTCCPAVPLHVNRAVCPGVVKLRFTAEPPGVIVPLMSVTEYNVTANVPVFAPG